MTDVEPSTPPILRYQQGLTLDKVSAYATGLQVRLASGQRAYIALSATELAFYFHVSESTAVESEFAIHYDLEGRLLKVSQPGQYWRRSLSGRALFTHRLTGEERHRLKWSVLHPDDVEALVGEMHANASAVHAALEAGTGVIEFGKPSVESARERLGQLVAKAARFDVDAARRDMERFAAVYGRVAVLPPDQYNALVLQATQGCSYGGCVFCGLYRGVKYQPKTAAQFREHLQTVRDYHGQALRARRSIFLGEANALSQRHETLVQIFQVLNEQFELPPAEQTHVPASWWLGNEKRFDGVSSFLDVFSQPQPPTGQFAQLRSLGLRRLYVGVETGCDELLRWLRKPATPELVGAWVDAIVQADIQVGVIVLLGAGGEAFYNGHVRDTTRLLNQLPLGRNDFIYFSPLVVARSGSYLTKATACGIEALTPDRIRKQEQEIRAGLRSDSPRGQPHVARYELESFVY